MPSQYPTNWPLSENLPAEEWPTPIAMRPRSHQPRHYSDSPCPVGSQYSEASYDYSPDAYEASDSQPPRNYIDSPCPAGTSTQSEDSWYVGNFGSDGASIRTRNGDVGNRDSNAASIISQIPTWDSTYSSSLYSASSAPEDNGLEYELPEYYASSAPSSGGRGDGHSTVNGRESLNGTPSSIGAFCDELMGSYKELAPNTIKGPSDPNICNTDKPLPPLPSQLRYSLSTSTLSSSDFLPREDENKENTPTPSSAVTYANTIESVRGGSVYSPETVPRRPDGGPGLPLPLIWDVGHDEAKRILLEHLASRRPYLEEASFILQTNLGLWGQDINDLKSEEDFGPALDLSAVSGNFRDVTGGVQREPRWGQRSRLREALLMHGKARYGHQSRIELSSISFHDVTTGEDDVFRNELLAHYDLEMEGSINGATGPKLMVYEVDVPLPFHAGQPPKFERWLHILISLPFLTHFPSNTPPAFRASYRPNSWVTIAVPLDSVTVHPSTSESLAPAKFLSRGKTYERLDFDFGPAEGTGGKDGVRKQVQFEFMDKLGKRDLFPDYYANIEDDKVCARLRKTIPWPTMVMKLQKEAGPQANFLAPQFARSGGAQPSKIPVRGQAGKEQDPTAALHSRSGSRSSAGPSQGLGHGLGQTLTKNYERIEKMGQEWHADMMEKVREDEARWARIHDVMTNGKCRVICRAEEKGIKMVLRSASKRIGKTGLSREIGH